MSDDRPIDLSPDTRPRRVRLRGEAVVRADEDAAIDAVLADLYIHAQNCVRAFGSFQLALTGSARAEPSLRRLLYDPSFRDFPWAMTQVWLAEDFDLPEEHERRAWPRVRDLIVACSGIPESQAHAIEVRAPDAAAAYARDLRGVLEWRSKGHDRLDFVLLMLGEAGHIDGHLGGGQTPDLCDEWADTDGTRAVGLSATAINAARCVAVLAAGEPLRASLAELESSLRRPPGAGLAPHLRPLGGELRWYVDRASCGPAPTMPSA